MVRRILLPALLALCAGTVWALDSSRSLTQYVHRIWTTQQGLPPGTIYDAWQTRDGFLWLATQTGLVRFDGVRFTPAEALYRGLPENLWVRTGFEDAEGALWIGTDDAGIYRIQPSHSSTEHFSSEHFSSEHFSIKDGLPSDQVFCLVPGTPGTLWACTAKGLAEVSVSGSSSGSTNSKVKIERLPASERAGSEVVRAACLAPGGTLWSGTEQALVYAGAPSGQAQALPLRLVPSDASVRAIACGQSSVWVGTTEGLVEIRGSAQAGFTQKLYNVKSGLVDDSVLSLNERPDGSLWVGTRGGFSRLRNGEFESFRPQDGLSQSNAASLFEDREGSLWVGTKLGLNQFLDGRTVPYTTSEGLPSNDVGPLLETRAGAGGAPTIWIGTLDAGLVRFDGRKFSTLGVRDGLASETVLALAERQGAIWAGTNRGLNVVVNGRVTQRFGVPDGLPSETIRSFAGDAQGVLWVGTAAGPAKFTGTGFTAVGGAPRDPVDAMALDSQGRLVFSTEHGLFQVDGGVAQEIAPDGTPLRSVDAIYRDEDGLLWLGTNGQGLQVLDNRGGKPKAVSLRVRDGLFDGEIFGIMPDMQGRLWMACSKGIFSLSRAEVLRFLGGQIKKIASSQLSPTDASRVIECKAGVQPAMARMPDGQMWFSTIRGVIVLNPERLQRNVPPPAVVIEDPIVNGESQPAANIADLAPGQKSLEFNYTGLSFLAPTRLAFRYKLEGYDKDWIDAGTRRQAFYTNLPPGKFRFRVTACNLADNLCNEAGSSVEFALSPAYYQRAWFAPLLLALLALAGWLAYQIHIRRLRERYDLIVAERSRIARELHDTLIQGFSGITMAMQALAGRLHLSEERTKLQDIIQDAAACLRETRRSVAGLRGARTPSAPGLAASIAQAARQITETKSVRLKLKLQTEPPNLPPEFEYNLLRIASEAITNAVKHSGARTIEITLTSSLSSMALSVADDGAGCEPADHGHLKPGHYGLIGMKERAAQIGAEFSFDSALGRGTIVTVVAPVERPASTPPKTTPPQSTQIPPTQIPPTQIPPTMEVGR